MIVSFDVGIKNLSFCAFGVSNDTDVHQVNELNVVAWDVVNLCGSVANTCRHSLRNKNICGKSATYMVSGSPMCGIHMKSSGVKPAPDVYYKVLAAKRPAATKLDLLADELGLEKTRDKVQLCAHCLETRATKTTKAISASDVDLIQLGVAIRDKLPSLLQLHLITTVLIENQISTIATRMKTIQGMLTQFFIDNGICDVRFISSGNKLKAFDVPKKTYAERKASGIVVTRELLNASSTLEVWREKFERHKKRDDLADAFLQGHWFISTH